MSIRLFSALEIPALIASQLTALQQARFAAHWVAPEYFHITLAYFGEVEEPVAAELDSGLAQAGGAELSLALKGVGCFGGKKPHALYAAVTPDPALEALHERHVTRARRLGIEVAGGRYTPHVTLARLPREARPEAIQPWIAANNLFSTGPFPVTRAVLYSSHSVSDGRHYEPERFYPFG